MGNQTLRPTHLQPFSGFSDDQISYLKDKFEILSGENDLLSPDKIAAELHTSLQEAENILNYIDFQGHGSVDFYEFVCAAASLHQNDSQSRQFIFQIYASGSEMDQECFSQFYSTVFKYLKSLNLIREEYAAEVGAAKFKQYDYNHNEKISFDQFQSMLKNDYHCRLWMETLGFAAESPKQPKEKVLNHELAKQPDQFQAKEEQGEQFQATNAWTKVCDQMNPLAPGQKPTENKAPNVNLDIGYVYGYRSYDTRDNVRYNSQGEIVYHTAACGIVLNKNKNTMRVNTSHNDDIVCLDVNASKGLVATGELGRWPSLIIWDANSLETKAVFAKKLERNINNVAISKSGRYVAASSMNEKHQIAVYDIAKSALVAFGQGPKSVIFAIKFNEHEDQVVCACEKEVVFCRFQSGKLQSKKGVFGKAPLNPNLAIATLGDSIITSMTSGLLVQWKGNFANKVFKQHSKSVGALCQRADGGIISGDALGNIIVWSANMSKQRQICLQKLLGNVKSNNIRLIALSEQQGNILAGTRGGEIIQIQKGTTAQVIVDGHFDKQLWGLCVSNNKRQFYTGGEDKLLIKWDADKRKITIKKRVEAPIKCLDLSRQNLLAVGHSNGVVNLHDAQTLNQQKKITNHKNPDKEVLSAVKFSADGSQLAVAYCPPISRVYLYDLNAEKIKKLGECKGASTRIVTVDFSVGGDYILATSIQPLFYKTPSCSLVTPSLIKAEPWSTMNSKFTWFTRGIWPPCADATDINFVDRSNSKRFLATADDFSKVKVFRYPVCNNRQLYSEYKGHSSHVTAVKWSFDDKLLFSAGGLQKSIIQWNVSQLQDYSYEFDELPKQVQKEQEQEEYQFGNDEGEGNQEGAQFKEEGGDEALAVKPFLGQVKASTPLGYRPTHKNEPPAQDLKVKHVWGVRNLYINDQVRNQVRYNANGSSCYFITAALGVQMNIKTKEQTFYQGQSDDLVSFAITKDRKYCATGQMAQLNHAKPADKIVDVHVWDAESKQLKAKLSKFHKRAVVLVEFSPSGKILLTVGQDDKNSLAVYDWEVGRIAWSSPVDGAKVTAAAWKNESEYMTVGLKHAKFWTQGKGVLGKVGGKWDPMVSVVHWNDKFVTGGCGGNVYVWAGNTGNASRGHQGQVDCLAIDLRGNLYSGCSKGVVVLWKFAGGKLVQDKKLYDVASFDHVDPGVLSMDFTKDNLLLCTRSSSVYEIPLSQKSPKPEPLITAHCKGELWAEAWSQDKLRFVTGGDDRTLRLWDSSTYKQLSLFKMKEQIRGVDWHKKQNGLIVAGDFKGKIYLFDSDLNLLDEAKTKFSKTKPRQEPFWIQDIKFSPDGSWVAFGAHGGASHVQIFGVQGDKFSEKGKVINAGLTSALLSVDWSQSSDLLAVVSQAYQLKFLNLQGPVSASSCRDVKWASWSGKFGFCVQQVHQDVNYSKTNCVAMSPSRSLIATGGDDQKVRLFTYPVTIPRQHSKPFTGHSSHVTRVLFSGDQQLLLSTGGNDRTIILWEVVGAREMEEQANEQPQEEEQVQQMDEQAYQNAQDLNDVPQARPQKAKPKQEKQAKNKDEFQMEDDQQGDQFMAVKPWLGAIKQPSKGYYKSSGKPPKAAITLAYAHGYRSKDCRNNLKYLSQKEIAYHTAGLGVILNTQENAQSFFDMHADDIISMAWNQKRDEMFTGQMGAKPAIYRWNREGEQLKCYKAVKKGVSAIAVNGTYLVASGLDDDHYVYVFDVEKAALLASQKGGRDVILGLKWVNQSCFVSVGLKHYKYWQFAGKGVKAKTGVFGKNCNLLCGVQVKDEKVYTGASDGSILVWSSNSVVKNQKGHTAAVNALCVHENVLLTGSNDQSIKIWTIDSLKLIATVDCKTLLQGSVCKKIRAIDVMDNKILVGTLGSEIYQIEGSDKIANVQEKSKFRVIAKNMSGHYSPNFVTNQVWGLGFYDENQYLTCSDDGTLRIWDLQKREQVAWVDLKFNDKLKPLVLKQKQKFLPDSVQARCLGVSEQGTIVIGCKDGTVRILDSDMRPKWCSQICKKEISHIKFSPDGSVLAIGAHDCRIYLYDWSEQDLPKLRKGKPIKHSSYIKHFDFSRDGNWLHSTCGAYELLFWDVSTGAQITSGATMSRDQQWATWNVTLGWPVQGIWQPFMDGTDLNSVDRSNSAYYGGVKLLASGDDFGKVRLLEYPCVLKNSQGVIGRGHSSHVTCVKFSQNDKMLISTGGEDQTVLQWEVQVEQ